MASLRWIVLIFSVSVFWQNSVAAPSGHKSNHLHEGPTEAEIKVKNAVPQKHSIKPKPEQEQENENKKQINQTNSNVIEKIITDSLKNHDNSHKPPKKIGNNGSNNVNIPLTAHESSGNTKTHSVDHKTKHLPSGAKITTDTHKINQKNIPPKENEEENEVKIDAKHGKGEDITEEENTRKEDTDGNAINMGQNIEPIETENDEDDKNEMNDTENERINDNNTDKDGDDDDDENNDEDTDETNNDDKNNAENNGKKNNDKENNEKKSNDKMNNDENDDHHHENNDSENENDKNTDRDKENIDSEFEENANKANELQEDSNDCDSNTACDTDTDHDKSHDNGDGNNAHVEGNDDDGSVDDGNDDSGNGNDDDGNDDSGNGNDGDGNDDSGNGNNEDDSENHGVHRSSDNLNKKDQSVGENNDAGNDHGNDDDCDDKKIGDKNKGENGNDDSKGTKEDDKQEDENTYENKAKVGINEENSYIKKSSDKVNKETKNKENTNKELKIKQNEKKIRNMKQQKQKIDNQKIGTKNQINKHELEHEEEVDRKRIKEVHDKELKRQLHPLQESIAMMKHTKRDKENLAQKIESNEKITTEIKVAKDNRKVEKEETVVKEEAEEKADKEEEEIVETINAEAEDALYDSSGDNSSGSTMAIISILVVCIGTLIIIVGAYFKKLSFGKRGYVHHALLSTPSAEDMAIFNRATYHDTDEDLRYQSWKYVDN